MIPIAFNARIMIAALSHRASDAAISAKSKGCLSTGFSTGTSQSIVASVSVRSVSRTSFYAYKPV
jgi:hypothetical protein